MTEKLLTGMYSINTNKQNAGKYTGGCTLSLHHYEAADLFVVFKAKYSCYMSGFSSL